MRSLIDPEGPVLQFITKIVYSVWLNLLWFICCIPIFTIGPATTALFYTCQKIARDEEGYVTLAFFRSFKANFKQGTIIGLIMTGLGVILGIDGYVLYHLYRTSPFWAVLTACFLVACAAWLIVFMWIFPLLAHFDNTTLNMFKNSIMIGMRFLLVTLIMAVVYAGMALLIIFVMTPLVTFGMGTCAFINSLLLKNVLIMLEKNNEENGETEEESEEESEANSLSEIGTSGIDASKIEASEIDASEIEASSGENPEEEV